MVLATIGAKISYLSIHILFGIAFIVFAYVLWASETPIFVNGLFNFLGKLSYSAYLSHFAVLSLEKMVLHEMGLTTPLAVQYFVLLIITLLLTMLISTFLRSFVEKPSLELCKKLINHIESERKGN